ncbi:MAG: Wzz/FepE/Etk N-terminal domain-containing protein [Caldilineales bacterium]
MQEKTAGKSHAGSPSIRAILRRRWWLIAAVVAGALVVTLLVTLNAPQSYRSSLRLQALALDDQEVALYTRRASDTVGDQIALTQFNFNETLQNSLIAWRTIRDLGLDISASTLLKSLNTTASGDFVTVTYDAPSPQQAMDVLNRHVENAMSYYNSVRSRPASITGQFIAAELTAQGQTLKQAQQAVLQFQLEHTLGDLPREINALQDVLRSLRTQRDAAAVQAAQADAVAQQYTALADQTEAELADAQRVLDALLAAAPASPSALQQAQLDAQAEQTASLRQALRDQRGAAAARHIEAEGARAALAQTDVVQAQRSGDLAQLLSLSSEYGDLQATVDTAAADYEFLRSKAAEARLKQAQVNRIGSLQIVDPAFLPTEPGDSAVLQLMLLVTVVGLLVGLVLALLLEFISPTRGVA